jgi:hypothetical protein
MVWANVGNDADGRPGHFAEPNRLANLIDPHFDNRSLMTPIEAKESLWNSNPIIEIPLCLQNFPPMGHYAGNHFFRRRLAIASRHCHDWNVKPAPMMRR